MVLSIHFTSEDLTRTSVAACADPLWEVLLSAYALRDHHRPLELRLWMQRLRTKQDRMARMRPGAHWLSVLAPLGPYVPDFLTPDAAKDGLDAGLEVMLSTPRSRLSTELQRLAKFVQLPAWVRPIAKGNVAALTDLAEGLRAYHDAAIAPYADLIQASVDADRARRAHSLLDNGLEGMFDGMRPHARWQPPVLEVDYPVDQQLPLAGRGLRLVPSFFCDQIPISLADPDLPPVLIYPISRDCRWPQVAAIDGHRPLDALMGATRAATLRALDVDIGVTTTQLARRLGTSPASASRHASVLREAGLTTTHRNGRAVLHILTQLGVTLLEHDS
ncbi:MAG: helix-turn-helix transcriptional regulator [Actinobacteria bacterium]|nr:helix-turn-helix transcriptional regulator [Actinomycetota bacterium]